MTTGGINNRTDARPGLSVNIVVETDLLKEVTDVRGAIIYEITGDHVILSQTNPPLTERHVKQDISVTYTIKGEHGVSRLGFDGRVMDIINEYRLSSSSAVSAILVKKFKGFKQYNLRMHYRVKAKLNDFSIALYMESERMNLLDISIGGASFCCKRDRCFETGEKRKVILSINEQRFHIDSRILSCWIPSEGSRNSNLEYVRIQFLNTDKTCNRLLGEKIMAMQREHLSKN